MSAASRLKLLGKELKENRTIYLFLLPGIMFLLVVKYAPMYGLQIAFKDYNPFDGVWASPWTGFKYFRAAFDSDLFWRALRNTVLISACKFIVGMPAPIIFALLLNEIRLSVLKRFVQTVSYFPHLISWVIIGGFAYAFFGYFGFINGFLNWIGLDSVPFYQKAEVWVPVIVFTDVWKGVGWSSILYLAALSAVNTDLYEAIEVDGGGRFSRIRYVDIPVLMPVFAIMLILSSSSLISGNFDQVYAIIGDSIVQPGSLIATRAETLEIYTYRVGLLEGKFGFSGSIGFLQNATALVLILTTNFIAGRLNDDKRLRLW